MPLAYRVLIALGFTLGAVIFGTYSMDMSTKYENAKEVVMTFIISFAVGFGFSAVLVGIVSLWTWALP